MELEKPCPKCKSSMQLVAKQPETTLEPIVQFKCLNETCGHHEAMYGKQEEGEP